MVTRNQLVSHKRAPQQKRQKSRALQHHPQKHGVCLATYVMTPCKPNSAKRKVARILLSNGKVITAYIPGEGHILQEHSQVLVRGGKVRDLPGVRYHIVRGKFDATPPHSVEPHKGDKGSGHRKQARSKYGQKDER